MFVNYHTNIITMSDPITKSPVIRQGWLRVLLYGCAFFLLTLLIAVPAILSLTNTSLDDLKGDPLHTLAGLLTGDYLWLMIVLEFVIALVSVFIFRLWMDRRGWMELGWGGFDELKGEALTGLFMGPALLGI